MRTVELFLVSLPVLLLGAWFLGVRHASYRFFLATAILLSLIGGLLFWFGARRDFTGHYTPAHLQDGRIVRGQSG